MFEDLDGFLIDLVDLVLAAPGAMTSAQPDEDNSRPVAVVSRSPAGFSPAGPITVGPDVGLTKVKL
jgi:hypothetical protein